MIVHLNTDELMMVEGCGVSLKEVGLILGLYGIGAGPCMLVLGYLLKLLSRGKACTDEQCICMANLSPSCQQPRQQCGCY